MLRQFWLVDKKTAMSNTILIPNPKTYIGPGSIENLSEVLRNIAPRRVLVISDPQLLKVGVVETITSILDSCRYDWDLYTDIIPEPTLQTGQNLIDYMRDGNFSLVIGIGGGSVLDMAKLAAVLSANRGLLEEYLNLTGRGRIDNRGIPKIIIPTTSGTGTEVTNISVLSIGKSKDVVAHDYLMADVAIVDPNVTMSVPKQVTAATGADALTHAIESFISVNKNPISDAYALQAIKMIGRSLKSVVEDGKNREAREAMSYGSYLAGLAFFNAGVGAVHALAYPLGGLFGIAHGESNALLLPYVLSYIKLSCAGELKMILEALLDIEFQGDNAEDQCVEELYSLMRAIGIPETLQHYNIPAEAITDLAEDAVQQKRLLARCPMKLEKHDIEEIYRRAYWGELKTKIV